MTEWVGLEPTKDEPTRRCEGHLDREGMRGASMGTFREWDEVGRRRRRAE